MSQPYLGQIMLFAGNFPPVNYAWCDGSLQQIANNDALFNLIGTTYGGDGVQTFGLPDLRGRVPIHMGTDPSNGQTYVQGQLARRPSPWGATSSPRTRTRCRRGRGRHPGQPLHDVSRRGRRHLPIHQRRAVDSDDHPVDRRHGQPQPHDNISRSWRSARHRPVRHLPPRAERHAMSDRYLAEIRIFRATSPRTNGPFATGRSWGSRRTPPCSPSSVPTTAATALAPSPFQTSGRRRHRAGHRTGSQPLVIGRDRGRARR